MPAFRKSSFRLASSACEAAAEKIQRAAEKMGLEVWRDGSRVSASEYVMVQIDEDEVVKIRVSDHEDRYGGADYHVWCDERASILTGEGAWYDAVAWLCEKTGKPLPPTAKKAFSRVEKARLEKAAVEQRGRELHAAEMARRAEKEAALIEWNPARWAEIADLPGKAGREKRRIFRRQAEMAA